MFERKWRCYKLIQIVQKALLVICTVIMFDMGTQATFITAGIHGCFFCVSAYSQPYIATATDLLATFAMLADFGTTVVAIMILFRQTIPDSAWGIVAGANVVLPLLAAGAGALYSYQQMQIRKEGEERREEMLKLKEEK